MLFGGNGDADTAFVALRKIPPILGLCDQHEQYLASLFMLTGDALP